MLNKNKFWETHVIFLVPERCYILQNYYAKTFESIGTIFTGYSYIDLKFVLTKCDYS